MNVTLVALLTEARCEVPLNQETWHRLVAEVAEHPILLSDGTVITVQLTTSPLGAGG